MKGKYSMTNGTISRREFVGGPSGAAALGGVAFSASRAPAGLATPLENNSLPVGEANCRYLLRS